ncbi:MAG: ABC transporter substrate-binding protein [Alphaproteobacteria bacterium]
MNKHVYLGLLAGFVILLLVFYVKSSFLSKNKLTIAITQIAPHPSLDQIRKGIIDEIKANIDKPYDIVFQNAQGNIATAAQIASQFKGLFPDIIIPITTPSAQTIFSAMRDNKSIPIVFAAITDPVAAKLLSSTTKPGENITGVYDDPPLKKQAELISVLLGLNSGENITIGIVYNPGEANSVSTVDKAKDIFRGFNINILEAPATSTTEVSVVTRSLVGRVDAIYFPNDNTVVMSLESILRIANENKIPVFSSDPESVQRGCLATIAPDQYRVGVQVGKMVADILLARRTLKEISPEIPLENVLVINMKTARHLGIPIPEYLIKKAQIILN